MMNKEEGPGSRVEGIKCSNHGGGGEGNGLRGGWRNERKRQVTHVAEQRNVDRGSVFEMSVPDNTDMADCPYRVSRLFFSFPISRLQHFVTTTLAAVPSNSWYWYYYY